MVSIIIAAGGSGTRMNSPVNKIFLKLGNETVIERTLAPFFRCKDIGEIIIAGREQDIEQLKKLFKTSPVPIIYVTGGATRTESVRNALSAVHYDTVLIHDGARPYVTGELIQAIMRDTEIYGASIAGVRATDTVKLAKSDGIVYQTLPREDVVFVQTPQGFKTAEIIAAYKNCQESLSDDAAVFERNGGKVHITLSSPDNKKITVQDDINPQMLNVKCSMFNYASGIGYDLHKLVEGRPLILGGITIPHKLGLLGHSDADAVVHAVMDAMLSAAGLRDIGTYFPDTDPAYKNINSILLLKRVTDMLIKKGYRVSNISASILCEKPKLKDHIPKMCERIANTIGISSDKVALSATTLEGIGLVGREEAIACHATCLLINNYK